MIKLYDLMNNCNIQGAYIIKAWDDENETYVILASGSDFEIESHKLSAYITDCELKYIYSVDGVLNLEIEMKKDRLNFVMR